MKRRSFEFIFFASVAVGLSLLVASCGGNKEAEVPIEGSRRIPPSADVAELEIRGHGIDRFTTCAPPGEIGQHWVPTPFPYTPPPPPPDAGPMVVDEDFIARTKDRTPTELAVDATHRDFRACYRRGLVHNPVQDGRVAIVLRIGPDGRVAKVEEYAACELVPESIACMKAAAQRLRFPPPPGGSDTVTIPAAFTSRDGVRRTSPTANDSYTASAFLTIESARPALHACEEQARRDLRPMQATGTFTLKITADGKVTHAHIDPWTGEQSLLACGAKALEQLKFAPPPSGTGTVIARLNFNPRQGTR
jgi:hypothetical protein